MGISKDRTADGQAARAQPKQLQTKVAGKVLIRSIRTFAGFGPAERVVTADQGVQIVLDPIEEIRVPTYLRTALKFGAATVFVLSSAMIALHAFNYLSVQFNPRNPFHVSYAEGGWAIPAHFYCAGLALLLAPVGVLPYAMGFAGLAYGIVSVCAGAASLTAYLLETPPPRTAPGQDRGSSSERTPVSTPNRP